MVGCVAEGACRIAGLARRVAKQLARRLPRRSGALRQRQNTGLQIQTVLLQQTAGAVHGVHQIALGRVRQDIADRADHHLLVVARHGPIAAVVAKGVAAGVLVCRAGRDTQAVA